LVRPFVRRRRTRGSDAIDGDVGDAENDPVDVGVDATRDDGERRFFCLLSPCAAAAAAAAAAKTRGILSSVRRRVGTRDDDGDG
jgi:hypothetical protein